MTLALALHAGVLFGVSDPRMRSSATAPIAPPPIAVRLVEIQAPSIELAQPAIAPSALAPRAAAAARPRIARAAPIVSSAPVTSRAPATPATHVDDMRNDVPLAVARAAEPAAVAATSPSPPSATRAAAPPSESTDARGPTPATPSAPPQSASLPLASATAHETAAPSAAVAHRPTPAPIDPPTFNAAYLANPPPAYPSASRRLGEEGKVVLRVQVSEAGEPIAVEIRHSSGFERLDQAAASTVRRWRFVPARQGETPVRAWVLVPVAFDLQG